MTRYPENTPISKEVFDTSGWRAALDNVRNDEYFAMWQALSSAAQEAVEAGNPSKGRVLWILADACSMMLRPESINEPFAPHMVMNDRRSTLPEDFSTEEIELLLSIYTEIDNAKLCARISDLVWLVKRPKNLQAATSAIDAYRQVAIGIESWIRDGRECWDRAIQLCLMLGTGAGDRLQQIEQALQAALLGTTTSDENLPLWIASLLRKHRLAGETETVEKICIHLENLANAHNEAGEIQYARSYYESAKEWYSRRRDHEKAAEMIVFCAEMWVKEAVVRQFSDSSPSHMIAASFYENAIQKYRTIPRAYRETYDVDNRINELRGLLSEAGERSLEEMGTISSESVDISELIKGAEKAVKGKIPLDALLALSNLYHGAQFQKIRDFSKKMLAQHPLQALFGATHMSSDGRVIAKSPSVNFGSENDDALWANMVRHYVMELEIVVQGYIWPALETIRLEHRIREGDFISLAQQSPLVPFGRENLVGKALFAGFDNDFVTALHLLVPQLEHLVRYHLKQMGVQTTNLDKNGIENEHGLSTLMENEQVQLIFGENLAFEIRALFCDSFGPNLRNELAHGLVEYEEAQSAHSIYAWWLLLRIVFNTFWRARQRAIEKAKSKSEQQEGAEIQ
ncbi:MAG: hypothetical protein RI964_3312 [Pseudomonadota bacterium]|jgi:hypothetical protein